MKNMKHKCAVALLAFGLNVNIASAMTFTEPGLMQEPKHALSYKYQMESKFYTYKTLTIDGLEDPMDTTFSKFDVNDALAVKNGVIIIGCIGYCPKTGPKPKDKGLETFTFGLDLTDLHRGIERKWGPIDTEKLRNGVKFHLGNKAVLSTSMFKHMATSPSERQDIKAVKLTPNWLPGGADLSMLPRETVTTVPNTWEPSIALAATLR